MNFIEKNHKLLKFGLSEKHTKFEKIFLMVLTNQLIYFVNVKTTRKIFSNYVCLSESLNFKNNNEWKMQAIFFIYLLIFKNHKINDTITGLDISSDHHIAILLVQNDRNYSSAGNPFALPKKNGVLVQILYFRE